MADDGKKRSGVSLNGAGGYDQDLYGGQDAAYDNEIGVQGAEEDLDDRERAVARQGSFNFFHPQQIALLILTVYILNNLRKIPLHLR